MKISIVILNFNTKDLIVSCINSLLTHYAAQIKDADMEIVVVDNNSEDESVVTLKKQPWFSHITLVQNKENVGFAKGNNIGVGFAKGKYILFLNSDTQMENSGVIGMREYLEKSEEVGILGGRIQNPNGTDQPSAGVFYTLPRVLLLLMGAERLGKLRFSPQKIEKVDWVSGAMMMIKKDLFEQLGGFDEKFFMYMEDMELCFRMKKRGKDVVFYPDCIIKHISHGSSNRGFAIVHIYKGLLYFYKKHSNYIAYIIVRGLLIAKACVLIGFSLLLWKTDMRKTYMKALRVAL